MNKKTVEKELSQSILKAINLQNKIKAPSFPQVDQSCVNYQQLTTKLLLQLDFLLRDKGKAQKENQLANKLIVASKKMLSTSPSAVLLGHSRSIQKLTITKTSQSNEFAQDKLKKMKERIKDLETYLNSLIPINLQEKPLERKLMNFVNEIRSENQGLNMKACLVEQAIDKIAQLDSQALLTDKMRFERLTSAIQRSVKLCEEITRLNLLLVGVGVPTSELTSPQLISWHNYNLDNVLLKTDCDRIVINLQTQLQETTQKLIKAEQQILNLQQFTNNQMDLMQKFESTLDQKQVELDRLKTQTQVKESLIENLKERVKIAQDQNIRYLNSTVQQVRQEWATCTFKDQTIPLTNSTHSLHQVDSRIQDLLRSSVATDTDKTERRFRNSPIQVYQPVDVREPIAHHRRSQPEESSYEGIQQFQQRSSQTPKSNITAMLIADTVAPVKAITNQKVNKSFERIVRYDMPKQFVQKANSMQAHKELVPVSLPYHY